MYRHIAVSVHLYEYTRIFLSLTFLSISLKLLLIFTGIVVIEVINMSMCTVCGKKTRNTDCVACDICRKLVHTGCSGLAAIEIECVRSNSRKIHYFCDNCDVVTTINKLKTELDSLKTQLEEVKNNQGKVPLPDKDILSTEEVINEVEERNRRSYNLILFNLPESEENTQIKRDEDDMSRVKKTIFSNGNENENNIKIMSCGRLGMFRNDKIRPMRISFATPQHAYEVLRTYNRKNQLYLNKDLTKRQQN